MTRTVTETGRFALTDALTLVSTHVEYTYEGDGRTYSYESHDIEGDDVGITGLANLAVALKNIPEDGALDFTAEDLQEFLQEWAADVAEGAELPFTFQDRDGRTQTYTPASMWEASGGCEWEESAQYGSDYGWNV